jgi:hypothetical protein
VEVTFYSRWIYKKMPVVISYAKQLVRIGDEAPTAKTLVDFGAIATNSFQRNDVAQHAHFQV